VVYQYSSTAKQRQEAKKKEEVGAGEIESEIANRNAKKI
jgi:hypothetical protein